MTIGAVGEYVQDLIDLLTEAIPRPWQSIQPTSRPNANWQANAGVSMH